VGDSRRIGNEAISASGTRVTALTGSVISPMIHSDAMSLVPELAGFEREYEIPSLCRALGGAAAGRRSWEGEVGGGACIIYVECMIR